VNLDYSDLSRERAFAAGLPPAMRRIAWAMVKVVAYAAERRVRVRMPVDTGRARASWGHSSNPAGAYDGIWIERPDALTIIEGSRVEYIEQLNEGSSTQAPAGFIDAKAEIAAIEGEKVVWDAIEALFK